MPIPLLIWGAVAVATATAAAVAVKKINEESGSSSYDYDEERGRLERQAKEERAQKQRDFILSEVTRELNDLCAKHVPNSNPLQVSSFDKLRVISSQNKDDNDLLRQLQQRFNESKDAVRIREDTKRLELEIKELRAARQALLELESRT